jgi:hypothetical protein
MSNERTEMMKVSIDEYKNTIEDIRVTSKTIHKVIKRLKDLWLKIGIRVSFNSYPGTFLYSIPNTHNSPKGFPQNFERKSDKPLGYPGWRGRWCGTIEILEVNKVKCKRLSFTDLVSGDLPFFKDISTSDKPRIHWIKTGTGSSSNNHKFEYDGIMFIQDFPAMYQEFVDNGEDFKASKHEYMKKVDEYHAEFHRLKKDNSSNHPSIIYINELETELRWLLRDLTKTKEMVVDRIDNDFKKKYEIKLDDPGSILVQDHYVMEYMCDTDYMNDTPHPDLESTVLYIRKIQNKIREYIDTNPEEFI